MQSVPQQVFLDGRWYQLHSFAEIEAYAFPHTAEGLAKLVGEAYRQWGGNGNCFWTWVNHSSEVPAALTELGVDLVFLGTQGEQDSVFLSWNKTHGQWWPLAPREWSQDDDHLIVTVCM